MFDIEARLDLRRSCVALWDLWKEKKQMRTIFWVAVTCITLSIAPLFGNYLWLLGIGAKPVEELMNARYHFAIASIVASIFIIVLTFISKAPE